MTLRELVSKAKNKGILCAESTDGKFNAWILNAGDEYFSIGVADKSSPEGKAGRAEYMVVGQEANQLLEECARRSNFADDWKIAGWIEF